MSEDKPCKPIRPPPPAPVDESVASKVGEPLSGCVTVQEEVSAFTEDMSLINGICLIILLYRISLQALSVWQL